MGALADESPVLLSWEEYVKFEDAYQSLPSIEAIPFVDHLRRRVTVRRPTAEGWSESRADEEYGT